MDGVGFDTQEPGPVYKPGARFRAIISKCVGAPAPSDLRAVSGDLRAAPSDLRAVSGDLRAAPSDLRAVSGDFRAAPSDLRAVSGDLRADRESR